ncbi:FAD-dependent oxidoreductase [Rhizobium lentis]|uniref:NAD(P)/FAD-dependent oxidoreductase n=1 Tax=Rhizobium lentis TaxID=1138194 RepID=UPI001C829B24|nr:FAD-dependent oxidoreductase [Rhizobium lentis]MBX5039115.1 FAD-dependent oxidoreductase [Rhizobium lentis]MBX5056456.1 FAD-dependent oxidoreductase [Rhizobium lentis]MBX5075198.1 FAD-dependent oxidoreductase [Rhizobium lentis]MBX5111371.1 FAD-dependent oxidoreductase [Rhizobium lentis]MBX5114339.1 FAD-dependent oxidoreductase [Rhizobium lentis]
MSSFVIVGAGECGARAAFALRERGFDGAVTLVGTEPLLPYERPPLSKDAIVAGAQPTFVADAARFEAECIQIITGVSVIAIDRNGRNVALSNGSRVAYDKLLLATGASARELPAAPCSHARIRVLRSYGDASAIRPHMAEGNHIAIIGGGFIGLELAASARKLGASVTLLEGLPRVLTRAVPADIAEVVCNRHRGAGVDLLLGIKMAAIDERPSDVRISLEDGRVIAANLVVVGIGSIPNVALADAAGLVIDNGIAVDQHLQTSDPDIFAAGDCCSFPIRHYDGRRVRLESWRNAHEQGALAAANMMGAQETSAAVPWFWSDQYDLTLQIAGLAEGAVTTVRRDLSTEAFILFHLGADGRLLAASGIGPGNAIARDIRLAEMLIAAGRHPDPAALAAPEIKLKQLLAA